MRKTGPNTTNQDRNADQQPHSSSPNPYPWCQAVQVPPPVPGSDILSARDAAFQDLVNTANEALDRGRSLLRGAAGQAQYLGPHLGNSSIVDSPNCAVKPLAPPDCFSSTPIPEESTGIALIRFLNHDYNLSAEQGGGAPIYPNHGVLEQSPEQQDGVKETLDRIIDEIIHFGECQSKEHDTEEFVKKLREKIKIKDQEIKEGQQTKTVIEHILYYGRIDKIKNMVFWGQINEEQMTKIMQPLSSESKSNALHYCLSAVKNNLDSIKSLIAIIEKTGKELFLKMLKRVNENNKTPLHLLITQEHIDNQTKNDVIDVVLAYFQCDQKYQQEISSLLLNLDRKGGALIHFAVQQDNLPLINKIFKFIRNPKDIIRCLEAKDKNGKTAIDNTNKEDIKAYLQDLYWSASKKKPEVVDPNPIAVSYPTGTNPFVGSEASTQDARSANGKEGRQDPPKKPRLEGPAGRSAGGLGR